MTEQRLQDSTAGKVLPRLPISSISISTRPAPQRPYSIVVFPWNSSPCPNLQRETTGSQPAPRGGESHRRPFFLNDLFFPNMLAIQVSIYIFCSPEIYNLQ